MKKQVLAAGLILSSACQTQAFGFMHINGLSEYCAMVREFEELNARLEALHQAQMQCEPAIAGSYNDEQTVYTVHVNLPTDVKNRDIKTVLVPKEDSDGAPVNLLKISFNQEQGSELRQGRQSFHSVTIINGNVVQDDRYTTKQKGTKQSITVALPGNVDYAQEPQVTLTRAGTLRVQVALCNQAAQRCMKELPVMHEEAAPVAAADQPLLTKIPSIEEPKDEVEVVKNLEKEIDASDAHQESSMEDTK